MQIWFYCVHLCTQRVLGIEEIIHKKQMFETDRCFFLVMALVLVVFLHDTRLISTINNISFQIMSRCSFMLKNLKSYSANNTAQLSYVTEI